MSTPLIPATNIAADDYIAQIDQYAREIQVGLNILVHALDGLSAVGETSGEAWNGPTETRKDELYVAMRANLPDVLCDSILAAFTTALDHMESAIANHYLGEDSLTRGPDSGILVFTVAHDQRLEA